MKFWRRLCRDLSEYHCSLSICLNFLLVYLRRCVFRLWQDCHKLTQDLKVSFWGPVGGKFGVDIKINNFVGSILKRKVYTSCYILLSGSLHALNADHTYLSAALPCYFRCHRCRNLVVVNCIVHWKYSPYSFHAAYGYYTCDNSCMTLLWLHHNHKVCVSYHKNGLVKGFPAWGTLAICRGILKVSNRREK